MMRGPIALVASLMLAACNQTAPSSPDDVPDDGALAFGPIIADGADPHWRLLINPNAGLIEFTDASGELVSSPYAAPTSANGRHRFEGSIIVELEDAACEIEGARYTMRATVQAPGHGTLNGCAAPRWDSALFALLPQIDACLAASPETRTVRYAGERDGAALVRMEGASGQVDCAVTLGAAPSANVLARNEAISVASEGDAIFVRGPGANPGGECYAAPEVRDTSGALVGWWLDPQGC